MTDERPEQWPVLPEEETDFAVPEAAQAAEARLLGASRHLRRREVSGAAGVSLLSARRFWRALGFPNVDDEAAAFTDEDLSALRRMVDLVRDGVMDDALALGMTRAIGRSVDRLASWQAQLLAEQEGMSDATRLAERLAELADDLEPLIVYAWRRHLAATVGRVVADAAIAEEDDASTAVRTVGFADLVSFTRVVRRLSERELAALVQRFEAIASDLVSAHGGRVVKTVGDEVMFVAWPPAAGAAIALDIAATMGEDDLLPEVRVGVSTGPVVARLGDIFGTTVNRASRLTAVAQPGAVLVDDTTAVALIQAQVPGISLEEKRRRGLRGLGPVTPWLLTRQPLPEPLGPLPEPRSEPRPEGLPVDD